MTSSIQWNWASCDQQNDLRNLGEVKLREALFSEGNCCIRAMGVPYVLGKAALALANIVASVAEPIIKGTGNIVGSFFSAQNCSLTRGLKYITYETLEAGFFALLLVALFPVAYAIHLVVTPIWVAIAPEDYIIPKLPEYSTEIPTVKTPISEPSSTSDDPLLTNENPSPTSNET